MDFLFLRTPKIANDGRVRRPRPSWLSTGQRALALAPRGRCGAGWLSGAGGGADGGEA